MIAPQAFRKKPVTIEALQYTGDNLHAVRLFCAEKARYIRRTKRHVYKVEGVIIVIDTLEGKVRANEGDWIVKGVRGEFYPVRNDIFLETYEKA